jgi:DNA-binding XRE family transcriptional regulator
MLSILQLWMEYFKGNLAVLSLSLYISSRETMIRTQEVSMTETLGDRMRMHRARLHLSQGALGEKIGLSTNGVSLIERGDVDPRLSIMVAIAEVLGVSLDYLVGRQKAPRERPRPRKAAPVG